MDMAKHNDPRIRRRHLPLLQHPVASRACDVSARGNRAQPIQTHGKSDKASLKLSRTSGSVCSPCGSTTESHTKSKDRWSPSPHPSSQVQLRTLQARTAWQLGQLSSLAFLAQPETEACLQEACPGSWAPQTHTLPITSGTPLTLGPPGLGQQKSSRSSRRAASRSSSSSASAF